MGRPIEKIEGLLGETRANLMYAGYPLLPVRRCPKERKRAQNYPLVPHSAYFADFYVPHADQPPTPAAYQVRADHQPEDREGKALELRLTQLARRGGDLI